jgi:predicted nucleotidyltransferase
VSGETWFVRGGPQVEALVRAAGLVVAHAGVRTALVGGLAVSCRLGVAHRATADVDLVADAPRVVSAGSAAENLVAAGIGERDEGGAVVRIYVEGTRVEIIETASVDPADADAIEPDRARLFVLSHRWALDTATPLRIRVHGSDVEAEVPVATPAALVAMKLHAFQDRNDDRKRASDAWDLHRLLDLTSGDADFARDLAAAPPALLPLLRSGIEHAFRDDVTRTRRWIRAYGDDEWATVASEVALIEAADAFLAALP